MALQRSARRRVTPEEAEALRAQQRNREAAQRERDAELRREVVRSAREALLGMAPTANARRSELDDVAYNIHNAYNWQGRGDQCVTAVVEKRNGRHVVFPQRFMSVMEQYALRHYAGHGLVFKPAGGAHLHAEMYVVLHYLLREKNPALEIKRIGVSKPICPLCRAVLAYLGIGFSEGWVTSEPSTHWLDPWRLLPSTCKPAVDHWRKKGDPDDDAGVGGGGGPPYRRSVSESAYGWRSLAERSRAQWDCVRCSGRTNTPRSADRRSGIAISAHRVWGALINLPNTIGVPRHDVPCDREYGKRLWVQAKQYAQWRQK
nr:nucleic acid/nucleotide deaminase domain-containing protein [Xanthomonas sp.]